MGCDFPQCGYAARSWKVFSSQPRCTSRSSVRQAARRLLAVTSASSLALVFSATTTSSRSLSRDDRRAGSVAWVPGTGWFTSFSGAAVRASAYLDEARDPLGVLAPEEVDWEFVALGDGPVGQDSQRQVVIENTSAAEGAATADALVTLMTTVGSLRVPESVSIDDAVQFVSGAVSSLFSGNYIESLPAPFHDVFNSSDTQSWIDMVTQQMAAIGSDFGKQSSRDSEAQPVIDKLGLTLSNTHAYREGNGWRVPVEAHLFQRNEGRHYFRLALCKRLLFQKIFGIEDSDPESSRYYEERARLLFRNVERGADHRGQELEVRLTDSGSGTSTSWLSVPPTDRQGRVHSSVWFSDDDVTAAAGFSSYAALQVRVAGRSSLPPSRAVVNLLEDRGVSVISDIDDTVKVSEVFRGHKQLLRNTFFKKFEAVDGMPELYRSWAREHGASFHFVSKSPPEFQEPLQDFLNQEGFPSTSLHLCPILSTERSTFKERQIEALMKDFPKRRFVLVGDSGERDPEIYATILRRHPGRVLKVIIRQVSPTHPVDPAVFEGVSRHKWQVIQDPAEVELRVRAPPTVLKIPGASIRLPVYIPKTMPMPVFAISQMPAMAWNLWR